MLDYESRRELHSKTANYPKFLSVALKVLIFLKCLLNMLAFCALHYYRPRGEKRGNETIYFERNLIQNHRFFNLLILLKNILRVVRLHIKFMPFLVANRDVNRRYLLSQLIFSKVHLQFPPPVFLHHLNDDVWW